MFASIDSSCLYRGEPYPDYHWQARNYWETRARTCRCVFVGLQMRCLKTKNAGLRRRTCGNAVCHNITVKSGVFMCMGVRDLPDEFGRY